MYDTYPCGEAKGDHLVCQIYQKYHEILTIQAIGLCKKFQFDIPSSEDLLQEFYKKVHSRPHQVRTGLKKSGITYLFKMLKHLCIDRSRHIKSISRIKTVLEHNPPRVADYQHLSATVNTELFYENMQKLLTEEDFKLMRMYMAGYTYREMAKAMDSIESTIGVRIHRMKKVLQKYFHR